MSQSWKLTLPCTRAEAETLSEDMGPLADLPNPPVLMTSEVVEDDPQQWQLDAYFDGKPNARTIAMVRHLVPSSEHQPHVLEKLPDEDWVKISQEGLAPVIAGRFHVRNSLHDPITPGYIPFLIGAGRAFGTGQHETTSGCLAMIDCCRRTGARFGNIADVGTGTGILAFAAMHLWPQAYATASDIDPASVEIAAENAAINHVRLGPGLGRLRVVQAAGVDHAVIQTRARYDLLIANILAGPLIELAPSLCAVLEEGGTLILAGLLDTQADRVIAAYRRQGMRLADRIDNGQWPTLRLRKRPTIGWKRPRRWAAEDVGEAPGFGSW
ncbi:50S ribosomal protein L11 methyltransferase [Sphingobium subterraneum]|uniref:Ribosomal protein L11 methyltransferase n=1 Tax=Sphingobium subterraneum TaxID=627688 RepID=A0A841J1U0_9SPHN|nr:50S ribosomal protein L11 methyltransferase [Sphingobium subterraneum]MBB6122508.1 ribosomal protein L11 methyltransferase [Sphingobium subterraneum]